MADDFEATVGGAGVAALIASGGCWLLAKHQRSQAADLKTIHPLKAFTRKSCGR